MKEKKLDQIDWAFLIVFLSYVIDIGNLKYVLAAFFTLFYILLMALRERYLSVTGIGRGFVNIVFSMAVMIVITVLLQLINGFQSYAVNEVIYFIAPIMVIWTYTSSSNQENIGRMLNLMFYISVVNFFWKIIPNLTIENLTSMSYVDSYSPFESGSAYRMIIFEWYFLYKGHRNKALISLLICILSFKRFCLIAAILLFVFHKWIMKTTPVKKDFVNIAIAVFVALPVLTCLILNDDVANWFYETFGVSLSKFTMSRSERIMMVVESDEINHGLGSTTVYLSEVFQALHRSEVTQWNLHNDLVRIYVECGIIGSVVFTWAYLKSTAFQRATFVLMLYIFAECYVNHLLGAGTVAYWLIVYLAIAYAAKGEEKTEVAAEPELEEYNGTANHLYPNL